VIWSVRLICVTSKLLTKYTGVSWKAVYGSEHWSASPVLNYGAPNVNLTWCYEIVFGRSVNVKLDDFSSAAGVELIIMSSVCCLSGVAQIIILIHNNCNLACTVRSAHITDTLASFRWLRVSRALERIKFKLVLSSTELSMALCLDVWLTCL